MRPGVFEQIGDYKIIQRIGHGGMGDVWLANKVGFAGVTSACVVKLLHRDHAEDPKSREYFINEARLAAQLDHPNIVKVIDAGEANGRLYLVMDRVDGVNLTEYVTALRRANLPLPLDVDITCYIIGEVLTALEYAHGRTIAGRDAGVVHFDVTPNNILVSSSGTIKLTDFGLSRLAAQSMNVSVVAGTPRYMSIEHHTATPRLASDIYGLGVVLHELLTNTRYHDGLEPQQIREAILNGTIQPMPRDDLPAWLVQLRTQMLAADYTERPAARVALEIILRNVPGYRRASTEIAKRYKDIVGPARSGMTRLLTSVPDDLGPLFKPPALPGDDDHADDLEHLHRVVSGPPVAAVSQSTIISARVPPPAQRPAELPDEVPTDATQVLEDYSQPVLASHVAPATNPGLPIHRDLGDTGPVDRHETLSASIVTPIANAEPADTTQSAKQMRMLLTAAVVLGTMTFVSLGWVIGTLVQDDEASDDDPIADASEPAESPAIVADANPTPTAELAPANPDPEPEPQPEPDPPPVEQVQPPPPTTEPKPAAEPKPAEPKLQPKSPKATPVKVVLYIKGHSHGTIKIGQKEYAIEYAKSIKLAPGSHTAKWRLAANDPWHDAGKLVVGNIAPNFYEFRLGDGSTDRTERQPGTGK